MPGPKITAQTKSLLTVTQAAKILKVSPDTLRNWEKSGKLIPSRTEGGARRYQLSLLQELVAEKAPEVAPKKKGMISISKAAKELGVSTDTLRNWEKKGQISAERTDGGARRYSKSQLTFLKRELGLDSKQLQIANPIVIEDSLNTIRHDENTLQAPLIGNYGIEPKSTEKAQESQETIYEQSKAIRHSSFSIIRLAIPVLILFLFILPIAFLGFNDSSTKDQGLEKKVYDLAGNVERLQNSLFNIASESGDLKTLPKSTQDVLAVSSIAEIGKYLELNVDTAINGSIAVEGEGVFLENITAPNIVYGLIAGANVTISGDAQNPVISANALTSTETLASVTARGDSTNTPVSFLGGAKIGNLLTFAQLDADPGTADNGSIYYNTSDNKYRCYTDGEWTDCDTDTDTVGESSTGDIEGVTAGIGLTGGGETGEVSLEIALTGSGSSVITSSNSGLEVSTDGLSMIRGCANGELLKWNSVSQVWACGTDVGGLSSAVVDIREGGVPVGTNVTTLNFSATDFAITESPSGTDNFAIDYANSGITRSSQNETISGNWTFSSATPLTFTSTSPSISIANTGVLTVTDGTNILLSLSDNGTAGTLNINTLTASVISGYTLAGNIVGMGSPTLSGLGTINGATLSGGSLSGGSYSGSGVTVSGGYTVTLADGNTFNISDGANTLFTVTDSGTVGNLSNIGTISTSGAITQAGQTLDNTYVNVNESPSAGDITGSFQAGLNLNPNSVTLGTDTTGDYVASITAGNGLTGSVAGEGSTPVIDVVAGAGITANADDIEVDQTYNFAFTGDVDFTPAGTGNITITTDADSNLVLNDLPSGTPTDALCIDASNNVIVCSYGGGGGGGTITAVGSMTTGDAFADATADDQWLGLGATAGRIEFDDQATDEINFLSANVGIGDNSPAALLTVGSGDAFQVNSSGAITAATGIISSGGVALTPGGTNDILLTVNNGAGSFLTLAGLATGTPSNGLCVDASNNVITCAYGTGGMGSVTQIDTGNGLTGGPITTTGTIALGDLFADWDQNGAFDIVLDNAASEFKVLESAGGAFYAIFDAGDLSADATLRLDSSINLAGGGNTLTLTGNASLNQDLLTTSAVTFSSLTLTTDLSVANGGTGASSLTGLLIGNGTSAVTGTTASSGIAGAISDETGSGALVFATSPTLVTPALGVATATSINGLTLAANADGFSVAGGTTPRTLTVTGANVTLNQSLQTSDSPTFVGATFSGLAANSAVYTDGSKNLTTSAPTSGSVGYWSRTSTTLSPATANDVVSITSNVTGSPLLNLSTSGTFTGTGTNSVLPLYANATTTGDIMTISGTGLTSGSALVLAGASGTGMTDAVLKITGNVGNTAAANGLISSTASLTGGSASEGVNLYLRTNINTTAASGGYGVYNSLVDATSNGNSVTGYFGSTVNSANVSKALYGTWNTVSTTSTAWDNLIANVAIPYANSGAVITTGTRTMTAYYAAPGHIANSTGGTTNIKGFQYLTNGTLAVGSGGTINVQAFNVGNPTMNTTGTSSKVGIYLEDYATNLADSNYAVCFDCDGTYSNSSAINGITWGNDANSVTLYRSASDTLRTDDAFNVNGTANISSAGAISGLTGFSQLAGTFTLTPDGTNDVNITVANASGRFLNVAGLATGTAANSLCVDASNNVITCTGGGIGGGDITAVGSMTAGDTFADATADDDWLGLGASAGRIEFDDQATDEINFLSANVGIGDASPASLLTVGNGDLFQVTSSGNLIFNQTAPTMTIGNAGSLTINDGTNPLVSFDDDNTDEGKISLYGVQGSQKSVTIEYDDGGAGDGLIRFIAGGTNGYIADFRDCCNQVFNVGGTGTKSRFGYGLDVTNGFTDTNSALQVNLTQNDDADATDVASGLQINGTSNSGDADTFYGIDVTDLTAGAATETAINIGTGWDNILNTPSVDINGSGAISGLTGYSQLSGSFTLTPDGTNDVNITVANASGRFLNVAGLASGTASNGLCVDGSNNVITCSYGGGGSGTITAVGNITTGDAFTSGTPGAELYFADNGFLGLGAGAGRIEFDDQTTDEVLVVDADFQVYNGAGAGAANITGVGDGTQYSSFNLKSDEVTDKYWYFSHRVGNDLWIGNYDGSTFYDTVKIEDTAPSNTLYVASSGNVSIGGDTTPTAAFNVGTTSQFQVNSSGAIAAATGITSSGAVALTPGSTNDIGFTVNNAAGSFFNIAGLATGTASNGLCLDGSNNVITCTYGGGTGDITAVGSMTSGDAFADATADDDWLGLGASAGRIEFDDQTIDEINFLSSNVGIGTSAPVNPLSVGSSITDSTVSMLAGTATGTSAAASIVTVGGTVSVTAVGGAVSASILQSTAINMAADVQVEGTRSLVTFTPSVANTAGIYGYQNNFRLGTSSSNISDIYGIYNKLRDTGYTGTVARSFGFKADDLDSFSAGEVTGQAGFNTSALINATNNTHVLLGTTTIPTGNFGIYSATTYDTYFAGNVGIGTSTPGVKLNVADGNDGSGGAIYAKDGGLTAMAVNGSYPLQVGNNTSGADSVRLRIDVNGAIDYSNAASTPTITTLNGNQVVNVLTGNFKVGNGTPSVTLNGEDAYIEGTFEVDGTANFGSSLTVTGLSTSSAVYTDGSSALTTTAPTSGTIGYWSRTGTTLSPATANDKVSIASTNTTGADLALTNTGVYTGTGVFNLTANSATSGTVGLISATGLNTGTALTITGGTALTTGGLLNLTGANYTHTAAETAYVARMSFTDSSTLTSGGSATNGLSMASTINTSGVGTKSINVFNIEAPTWTGCATGTCLWSGYKVNVSHPGASTEIAYGVNIQAAGISGGSLFGTYASNITPGAGTEVAHLAGVGWDTAFGMASAVAYTQTSSMTGVGLDFSSNITVPNSAAGNQNGFIAVLKDGGVSATSTGMLLLGSYDTGISLAGTPGSFLLDSGTLDITAAGAITGGTGIASSGTIAFSGLSTNGVVYTSGGTGTLNSEANLAIARGGTNTGSIGSAGSVAYSTGSAYAFTAVGSTNNCLISNGSSAPSWSACTTASTSPFVASAGVITKVTSTDKLNITAADAADYAALFDTSIVNTVDLVEISNTGFASVNDGVDGLSIAFANGNGTNNSNAAIRIAATSGGTSGDALQGLRIDTITATAQTETALMVGSNWDTVLDSANLDISGAGAITGATGINSSGTIAFGGLTTNGVVYTSGGTGTLNSEANLAIARGGTNGSATPTAGAIAYGTGTAYAFSLAGTGGDCLISGGAGSPTWGNCTTINADSLDYDDFEDTMDYDAALITNQGVFTSVQNFTGTTTNGLTYNADATTTGSAWNLSVDGLTTGKGFDISSTATTLTSADLFNITSSGTYTTAQTVTGSLAELSRSLTINAGATTLSVTGPVARFSDSCTVTSGTCTSTASVLEIAQNYTSNTGSALMVSSAGGSTGFVFRANDDGTTTDSTPFLIDNSGNVGIGTTTISGILHAKLDQNNTTDAIFENTNSSTAAQTILQLRNGTSIQDSLSLRTAGTGFTTTGVYVQDGGAISAESNLTGGLAVVTRASAPIMFATNGHTNERMRIDATGNVGIGDTSPDALLDLDSSATTTNIFGITQTGSFTGTGTSSVAQITSAATTGDVFSVTASSLTSGSGIVVTGSSATPGATDALVKLIGNLGAIGTSNGQFHSSATITTTTATQAVNGYFNTTNANTTAANNAYGVYSIVTDSSTQANSALGVQAYVTSTGNAAKTLYGAIGQTTTSSTTADTQYALFGSASTSTAISSGTRNINGIRAAASSTANNTGGLTNLYGTNSSADYSASANTTGSSVILQGGVFYTNGVLNTGGTISQYGLYVANGTSSTVGSSTKFGLFLEDQTGSDNNFAIYATGGRSYHGGDFGIGMDPGTVNLAVQGTNGVDGFRVYSNNQAHFATVYAEPAGTIYFQSDTTYCQLPISSTSFTCPSDSRLKKNISNIDNGLEAINKLRPTTFDMISGGTNTQAGFIAQEVQQVLPDAIYPGQNGMLTLSMDHIVPYTVKAVQELDQKLENALLTIGDNGYATKEFTAQKLSITADANITGTITAGNYSIDAAKLNRTGTLASIPVNTNKASIADAVNALNEAQKNQENRIASVETQTASQSAQLADQSLKLENTEIKTTDLETRVIEQKSALELFREQIASQISALSQTGDEATDSTTIASSDPVLTSPDELIASGSASVAEFTANTISGNKINISESLTSLGETKLANTFIAGDLTVDGTLSITNGNELNVIGSGSETDGILYIQRSPLASAVNFFDGLITLDKTGGFKAQSVTVAEFKVVANKTSGTGTIKAGQKTVVIDNPLVKQNARILITPTSNNNVILAVTEKTDAQSFTVSTAIPSTADLTFDWWLLQEIDE